MATLLKLEDTQDFANRGIKFDLYRELRDHAWMPFISEEEAEELLNGELPFTYLIRPNDKGRGFKFSNIGRDGQIEHHFLTLVHPVLGMFRNIGAYHIGTLPKVICDMMECKERQLRPLI